MQLLAVLHHADVSRVSSLPVSSCSRIPKPAQKTSAEMATQRGKPSTFNVNAMQALLLNSMTHAEVLYKLYQHSNKALNPGKIAKAVTLELSQ